MKERIAQLEEELKSDTEAGVPAQPPEQPVASAPDARSSSAPGTKDITGQPRANAALPTETPLQAAPLRPLRRKRRNQPSRFRSPTSPG
jgi:hypothetical protein